MTVQKKIWISGLMLAALSLAPTADAQQKLKTAVADDIFAERPIGDATIARLPGGGWILTGTTLRTGARHGVELWTSPDAKKWRRIG